MGRRESGQLDGGVRRSREGRSGGDDDLRGYLVPFSFVVEAAKGADGAENVIACGDNPLGIFDHVLEGEAETAGTAGKESGGVGVAIDGTGVRKVELTNDDIGRAPEEEGFLDGFTFGVMADGAGAVMAVEFGGGIGFEEGLCFAIYLIIHSNYPFSEHHSTNSGGFQELVPRNLRLEVGKQKMKEIGGEGEG